ncbi:inducible nitrate reductase [NADH] 2-like [Neltuma alba]|uniref:inducible nitrate reductase [NADH] 2-like n=1 Tax=Neltuma alba TaxID=207710 RepID=UPI0010A39639|nr:inducible nitrate reductase [NADH] 2-like [Prosopis alba]
MAATVSNHQYAGPLSGVASSFNVSLDFNFPPTNFEESKASSKDLDSSSEDENDAEEWKDVIQKANSEAESWMEHNASLPRVPGKNYINWEPPITLMNHSFITPIPLHFVRNHGPTPNTRWDDWTVEVSGLVKRPAEFTMNQLVNQFPSREFPVTLVCAGNRRAEQTMVRQSIGYNWRVGAASTSIWRGVPLRYLLKRCGIYSRTKGALYVCYEGDEDLPGGGGSKYGTSIKREIAMDPTRDVILAYMQNGERLAPEFGFPVRMIVPGFIAGRMVKWLKRIIVTSQESQNHYHYKDNRVFPSHVDAELANAEGWWYKPEYIINELNVNSVITTPCHGEILPINSSTTQKPYVLRGYAYSGGGRKVTRVEVTMDGGETWSLATLERSEKPNKYGKYWCWSLWSLEVEALDLLRDKEIAVRAWDEALNTQPEKLIWNVKGMMNNCWFKVKTKVCILLEGGTGIMFEHPTIQSNPSRKLKTSESNKSVTTPFMNNSASNMYSISEVKKHTSPASAWIIVHGYVYDCTRFLKDHPGGPEIILINAGTDCTEEFEAIHSKEANKMLEDYRIGEIMTTGYAPPDSSPNTSLHGNGDISHLTPITEAPPLRSVALNPREKIPCKLVSKASISRDARLFRFALPSEDQIMGLPVGKHIFVCANIEDKLCMRAYTPTTSVDEVGYFDLVVKIYFKGVHPEFPSGGLMSQHLDSLPIGSAVEVKGPLGHIEYTGRGQFLVHGKPKFAKRLAMFAGGTGIAPIYQVARAILKDPEDRTEMHIMFANRTEDDILLREELDEWAEKGDRFKVWYVVQESKSEGWEYSVGFITEDILREHAPKASDDTLALACGPPPMIQFAVQPNLEKLGYDINNNLLVF